MSSSDAETVFDNFQDGVFSLFGGVEPGTKKKIWYGLGIIIAIIIFILIIYAVYKLFFSTSFANGRNGGSGCGRYNQLQRAINMEYPVSQPEYEANELAKQEAAGMQYANQYQPHMENVYSGFEDRKTEAEIQHYQVTPQYAQNGITQTVWNDNVFKNIAYD